MNGKRNQTDCTLIVKTRFMWHKGVFFARVELCLLSSKIYKEGMKSRSRAEESSLLVVQLPGNLTGMFNTFMKCNECKVFWHPHMALSICGSLYCDMWTTLFQQVRHWGLVEMWRACFILYFFNNLALKYYSSL